MASNWTSVFIRIYSRAWPVWIAILAILNPSAANAAEWVAVHAGHLIREAGQPAEHNRTLLIHDGLLVNILDGFQTSEELGSSFTSSNVIDLKSFYVLPGLIDMHVHLTTLAEPGEALRTVTLDAADLAVIGYLNARRTVMAGVTTAVDLGTGWRQHEEAIYALRSAIAEGRIVGPRLLVAGSPISSTGSSRTGRFSPELEGALVPQGVCDGAADCEQAVREQIRRGSDIINVYDSGSLNDPFLVASTFTESEMRAIVATAHSLGRKVIADGHVAEGVNLALLAGADVVDTVPWPDELTWRLLHQSGATFVPHLQAFRLVFSTMPDELSSQATTIERRFQDIRSRPLSAERALQENIPIALGSDTGLVQHGDNVRDLEDLVAMGMTASQALAAGTLIPARALGLQGEIGKLEAGMSADLVAVEIDPQQDVKALRNVRAVMVRGRMQQ